MVSNGKYKSVEHRVIAKGVGPRVSMATFFNGNRDEPRSYGPIAELISEENPPLYQNFVVSEYAAKFLANGLKRKSYVEELKL